MPTLPFTIKINGAAAVTLKSLGLTITALNLENMQADTTSLTWTRKTRTVACPLVHDDVVEIFLPGPRRIFQGRARLGTRTVNGCPIKIIGPWSHLEDVTWQVNMLGNPTGPLVGSTFTTYLADGGEFWDGEEWVPITAGDIVWTVGWATVWDPGDPLTGTIDVNMAWTSRYGLFAPVAGFGLRTVDQQWAQLLQFFAHVSDPDLIAEGDFDWGGIMRPSHRTVTDISVAEAMRQTLTIKPDAALWFDYSVAGVPELNGRLAAFEDTLALEIANKADAVVDYSLDILDELIPAGVVLRLCADNPFENGLSRPYQSQHYPEEATCYLPNTLVHSLSQNHFGGPIAQEIYTSLAVRRSQGQIVIQDNDFSLGLRPGRVLSLAGDVELEEIQHWVQSVAWNPATGQVTCSVGYPRHLSLAERLDLKGWIRRCFLPPAVTAPQINLG